ncbi:CBM96 family carbohydrate-binding protein [Nonomuraea sp. KM90]|uniref:CBM96 family carbohydrate-binding protein n=1 Tax=Nonomuraea sp. KM90 TaxID=3457428 RepID=UPI003FCECCCD
MKALVLALAMATLTAVPSHAATVTATLTIRAHEWAYVSSSEPDTPHYKEWGAATVGLQGTYTEAAQPESVRRSFFGYDVSAIRGRTVVKAELTIWPYDHTCDNQIVGFTLWETGPIDRRTTWEKQPDWIREQGGTFIPWQPCSQEEAYWPFVMQPTAAVTDAVASASGLVTFGIRSFDETHPAGRLLLDHSPELRITYEFDRRSSGPKDPWLPVADLQPAAWAYVESRHRKAPHWSTGEPAPVGSPDGHRRHRSFFRFDLSSLAGHRIDQVRLEVPRADTCRPGELPVQFWETGEISEETTWHRQPAWLRKMDTYTWQACEYDGATLFMDVTEPLKQAWQAGQTTVTIGLRSAAEKDPLGWYLLANAPLLRVSHLPPLRKPTDLVTDNSGYPGPSGPIGPFACVRGEDRPYIPYRPRPEANVPGGAGWRWARWQWETLDGQLDHEERNGPGGPFRAYGPRHGEDGVAYRWRVRSEDQYEQVSEWSDWCEYVVDTTAPNRPPTVSGTPYSHDQPAGGPGVPGQFTFGPNGVTDVAGYYYQITGTLPWTWVPAGPDGTATVTWTPPNATRYQLVVMSADRAGSRPPDSTYHDIVVTPGT